MARKQAVRLDFVWIQIVHDVLPTSRPYAPPVETALTDLKLPEKLGDPTGKKTECECVIRHETGPEIVALIGAIAALAHGIAAIIKACKKARPETKIQVTVSSADQLQKVYEVLKSAG